PTPHGLLRSHWREDTNPSSWPDRTTLRAASPVLLLFDIDGTLLAGTTQPVGAAMVSALSEVHGINVGAIRTQIATDGRTDGEIARAILVAAGVSNDRIDDLADRVRDSCSAIAARLLPDDLSCAVLPGVR